MQNRHKPKIDTDEADRRLLLINVSFQAAISSLRKKYGIPKSGIDDDRKKHEWSESLSLEDKQSLHQAIDAVLREHALPDRWHEPVYLYTTTNNPMFLRSLSSYELRFEYESEDSLNIKTVWIRVDSRTTQREVLKAYTSAKRRLPQTIKKQPRKNIERDLRVLELFRDGQTYSQITKWLNDNYPDSFNTDQVSKIIQRMKKYY